MSDYYSSLLAFANSYWCPRDIPSIKKSFAERLKSRTGVRFIEPTIDWYQTLFSLPHPSGRGEMHNWLIDPRYGNLDAWEIAKMIISNNQYIPQAELTTHPNLYMLGYQNSLGPNYMEKYNKGHEFRHSLIYSMPYNIAYLYGLKRFNQIRNEGLRGDLTDYERIYLLSQDIKNWLNLRNEYGHTLQDELYEDVKYFNEQLDDSENEENLLYSCSDIENPLLDAYDYYIGQMP